MERTLDAKLLVVQQKLKANKTQWNDFGKYNYRSCEDILEAVKPLLASANLTLRLTDEVVAVGGRIYVQARAILCAVDSGEEVQTVAYAREDDTKKGMDGCQITGAASSYARKYALNGLFCIDDAKDSDFTNAQPKDQPKEPAKRPTPKADPQQQQKFIATCKDCGKQLTDAEHDWSVKWYGMPLCREHQKQHEKIR